MSDEAVRAIIEPHLATVWGSKTPIAWDNVEYKPIIGTSFIEPIFECVSSRNISISCERDFYLLSIIVNTPYNSGSSTNLKLADDLKTIFVNKNISGISFKSGKIQKIGNKAEWYRRTVLIDFYYNNIL